MNKTKALFLDRDGVINQDIGYLYRPEQVQWVSGIDDLLRHFQQRGYLLIIVTNQSGIGRGFYTEEDFSHLTSWMIEHFKAQGITINDVNFCPHHPSLAKPPYLQVCECRKPAPGMLLAAIEKWNIDVRNSLMIGDKWSDVQAAVNAKLARCYYLNEHMDSTQVDYAKQTDSDIILARDLSQIRV